MEKCKYVYRIVLVWEKKVLSRETYLELYQLNVILQDIINILQRTQILSYCPSKIIFQSFDAWQTLVRFVDVSADSKMFLRMLIFCLFKRWISFY